MIPDENATPNEPSDKQDQDRLGLDEGILAWF